MVAGHDAHPKGSVEWLFGQLSTPVVVGWEVVGITALMLVVVGFVASMVVLFSVGYMHGEDGIARYFALLALFTGILVFRRKRIQRQQNVELVKNQRASREARRRLKEASGHLKKDETEAFYEAVLKALTGYLVDKLNMPMADLSKESARRGLEKYEVNDDAIEEYLELADLCEMARYAPTSIEGGMEEVYSRSIKIISQLEQNLR
jgi:hypothetical protein